MGRWAVLILITDTIQLIIKVFVSVWYISYQGLSRKIFYCSLPSKNQAHHMTSAFLLKKECQDYLQICICKPIFKVEKPNLLSSDGSNCSMDLYSNIISLQLGSAIRTLGLYSLAICFMYLSNLMVKFCRSTNLENCGKLTYKEVLANENTYTT